jgi:hypothetical protein
MAKAGFPDTEPASFWPDPGGGDDRMDLALATSYLYYRRAPPHGAAHGAAAWGAHEKDAHGDPCMAWRRAPPPACMGGQSLTAGSTHGRPRAYRVCEWELTMRFPMQPGSAEAERMRRFKGLAPLAPDPGAQVRGGAHKGRMAPAEHVGHQAAAGGNSSMLLCGP